MFRRAFLKTSFFLGSIAFLGLDLLRGMKGAFAADPVENTSLAKAIASRNPDVIANYIQQNPAQAAASSTQDKIEALKLFKIAGQNEQYAKMGLGGRASCEKAAVILLSSTEKNVTELSAIINALGGERWLNSEMPQIQDSQLRKIANQALSQRR